MRTHRNPSCPPGLSGTLPGQLGLHVCSVRDLSGLGIHTGESTNRMELKAMCLHQVAMETKKGRGLRRQGLSQCERLAQAQPSFKQLADPQARLSAWHFAQDSWVQLIELLALGSTRCIGVPVIKP